MSLRVGDIMFSQPSGQEVPGMIKDVTDESVQVDFNHPLAGKKINFIIDILEIKTRE